MTICIPGKDELPKTPGESSHNFIKHKKGIIFLSNFGQGTKKIRFQCNDLLLPMHASVPEFTNLTISILGTAAITISAKVFSNRQGAPKLVPFFIVSTRAARTYKQNWKNKI